MAALSRMSRGEHRSITLTAGDLIILSSSLIPGNEEAVYGVIDALAKIGARVVTNAQVRVHVSGHAYAGELLFLYNGVRPRNVMPVHGTWRHAARQRHAGGAAPGCRRRTIVLAENGVSVDLVAGTGSDRGRGAGRQDVRRRADHRRRRRRHAGRAAHPVLGFHRGHRRRAARHRASPAAPPHLHSRGFSEDPKALEPAARKVEAELETLAAENSHRSDADRAGGAAHGRQVGGGDLPPPADDRADGHRDLKPDYARTACAVHSIWDALIFRPVGRM